MKRIIKFRAWDVIGKKWVYGDLTHNQKVTRTGLEPRTMVGGYEVDPESIGQFTGMVDYVGNSVYEGDELCIHIDGKKFTGTVEYNGYYGQFVLTSGNRKNNFSLMVPSMIEITGNSYKPKEDEDRH